ncbi:MAG: FAD:protein FMN transferase [Micromonosporaceae bacterium]
MTPETSVRQSEALMGTVATVELYDPVPDRDAVDDVFSWLHEVDRRFSPFIADSEVNRLDRGELGLPECSADLREVIECCAELWQRTDGYFDIYATGRLDPCGYVKGWAVQVASQRLSAAGAVNHCIEVGGDIQTRGRPAPDEQWQIGIRHPWQRDRICWLLSGTDLAVATSGLYERGLHVINPRTGLPADQLCSVTVVGRDLGIADAYATAAVAMGRAGLGWLTGLDGYECAVVLADGTAYESAGLPSVALLTNC